MVRVFFLLILVTWTEAALAQRIISGKVVTTEDGSAMPGVNIIIKGTSTGTVTDINGLYRLSVESENPVLVFSFIGYITKELAAGTVGVLDVKMEQDRQQLEEIVITGYREESRKALPGSVAIVKSDKIQNVPIASFDQVLQGRVPGMLVLGGSGQPGASAGVLIRGIKSLSGSNAPLYILDGVPIATGVFSTLNPNDFESITVLKDASAAALYGSRGSNGVILITTKKGKAGKTQISYTVQYGLSKAPENRLKVMKTNDKIDFEQLTGGSLLDTLSSEEIIKLRRVETNWQDVLFRTAQTMTHDLNIQGGNENTTFFISGQYLDQEGTVKETELKRYTAKINVQHEADILRFGMNTTLGYSVNNNTLEGNSFIGSPLNAVRWTNPYETPYDENGEYTKIRSGQPNALQELQENKRNFYDVKGVINAYADLALPFVPGLNVKTSWGLDYTQRETNNYTDKSTYSGQQATGQQGAVVRGSSVNASFIGTTSVSYHKTIAADQELFVSLYHEILSRPSKSFGYVGYGISGNIKNDGGVTVGPDFLPDLTGTATKSTIQSFFGEATYALKNKYNFKAGLRNDASSRFGKDNRTAIFYSGGVNWRISEEGFFQGLTSKVNFLKLYANMGTSGNQSGLGDFESLSLYAPGATYAGSSGIVQVQPENPSLGWETVQAFNVGTEFSTFANRLSGSFEFYINTTLDMLLPTQLSRTSGFSSITQNVGKMRNLGFEVDLTAQVYRSQAFSWTVNANFTNNKNEILKLVDGDEIVNGLTITKVGYSAGTNYVVKYLGVNPANGDALYQTKEGAITNEFSSDDLIPYGTRFAPRWGGFTNTFNYKGVELSVFFSWIQGSKVYNNDRTNVENPTYFADNMAESVLRAWKKPGDLTDVPRIQTITGLTTNPYQTQTTRYIEDGAFLRLRNVSLSYSLPESLISRAKLRSVGVFAQGQNLWTWFRFLGWDPELASGSLTGAQYPALRTVTMGLNLGF